MDNLLENYGSKLGCRSFWDTLYSFLSLFSYTHNIPGCSNGTRTKTWYLVLDGISYLKDNIVLIVFCQRFAYDGPKYAQTL